MTEKIPPVLSEEVQGNIDIPCEGCALVKDMLNTTCIQCVFGYILQAQRDDTYQKMLDAFEPLVQQARQEVAREIFEEIEKASSPMNTNMYGISLSKAQWQSLKDKHLKG